MDDLSDDSDISNLPQTGKSKQRVLLPPTSGALAELSDGSDVDLHSGKELPNHKFCFNFVETGVRGRQSATAKASYAFSAQGMAVCFDRRSIGWKGSSKRHWGMPVHSCSLSRHFGTVAS